MTIFELKSPSKGVCQQESPDAITPASAYDAMNVLPFDRTDRRRISPRPGLTAVDDTVHISQFIQSADPSGDPALYGMVPHGGIFMGPTPVGMESIGGGGGGAINFAVMRGAKVIVGGSGAVTLGTYSGTWTFATLVADTGKGTAPTGCPLCCVWNDRAVFAATFGQLYMSRIGDPKDWDYSRSDSSAAVSLVPGGSSFVGGFNDLLKAIVPARDDSLLLFGDHSVYRIAGDPGMGGSCLCITTEVGIAGPYAWCRDPSGQIWFMASTGLYRWTGAGIEPAPTDTNVNLLFAGADGTDPTKWCMCHDKVRNGFWLFAGSNYLFYDQRMGGFWPITTASAVEGCVAFDGPSLDDRMTVISLETGGLSVFDNAAPNDAGGNTTAFCWLGPVAPAGAGRRSLLRSMRFRVGDTYNDLPQEIDWTIAGGRTPDEAIANATAQSLTSLPLSNAYRGTMAADGMSDWIAARLCCEWVALRVVSTNTYFALESVELKFDDGGPSR